MDKVVIMVGIAAGGDVAYGLKSSLPVVVLCDSCVGLVGVCRAQSR